MKQPGKQDRTHRAGASRRGEALVAIVNSKRDWQIVREHLWYRIPVGNAPKRWPPRWLAFYQTKVFNEDAFQVRYFGRVSEIKRVGRRELFPDEPTNQKSDRVYYQVCLESVERLPQPIVSFRLRRIVFIPTTLDKLTTAIEVNDLFDDSPLEDALWFELKRLRLRAERQFFLLHHGVYYALDFALFCEAGNVDIETDGDTWHIDRERAADDNRRNNALASQGYQVLRFNTMQVQEEMQSYCVPKIVETVNRLGGVQNPGGAPITYKVTPDGIAQQESLFPDGDVSGS